MELKKIAVFVSMAALIILSAATARVKPDFSSPEAGAIRTLTFFETHPINLDDTGKQLTLTQGESTNPDLVFQFDRQSRTYQLAWKDPDNAKLMKATGTLDNTQRPSFLPETFQSGLQLDSQILAGIIRDQLGTTATSKTGQNKGISVGCAMAIRSVNSALATLIAALQLGDQAVIDAAKIALNNALALMDLLCRRQ